MRGLESDLKAALKLMSAGWQIQNDYGDKNTNFIYRVHSLKECLDYIDNFHVDKNYALHRWYNFHTSVCCENIFCENDNVVHAPKYDHDVDIYINGVPFDVKLTVYPKKLSNRPYDLNSPEGKNDLIRWYYANQSKQSRKQFINRIYVVCDAKNPSDNMEMKSNFSLMRERITDYMMTVEQCGFNEVVVSDGEQNFSVKSDIVWLHN